MLKPLSDRVVIKVIPSEKTTTSGIIIPDTALEKSQLGEVIAHGAGRPGEPISVKVGDKVLFSKHAGSEITIDNEKYLIMSENPNIWAVL